MVFADHKRWRKRLIVWLAVAAFIVTGLAGGCNAHRRPPSPDANERTLLREPPLPYTVIVKPWDASTTHKTQNPGPYAENLAKLLISSRAFHTTRFENSPQATGGDLVATSTGMYCNTAVIPLWTLLSLGIIPTVFDDENCEGMELRRAGAPTSGGSVHIEFRDKETVVMGWAAVIMGILPGWSYGSARSDTRVHQRLRLEVMNHRAEIESLRH